jgi:hypothetical protein
VTTAIGKGCNGDSGDGGPANSACIAIAEGMWIDTNSQFYISQSSYYRIRKVASNIITGFAGNGNFAFAGDGGPAKNAQLNVPRGTFVDTNGNVYIADDNNCRVRLVDATNIISTIGGTGLCVFTGNNGPFSLASITYPRGIWKDTIGNLFVTDSYRILRVSASTSIIITIAGGSGSSADNIPATSYSFSTVWGIWGGTVSNIFVSEYPGHKVKKLSLSSLL